MHDSRPAADDDDAKIRATALDYIGGVLEADPARMERCLHPNLAKRAYLPGVDGKPQLSQISALNLIRGREYLGGHSRPACRGRRPRWLRGIRKRSNHVRPLG
jgi:hypothetical protein